MQVTDWLRQQVTNALNEDIGSGDLSAKLIAKKQQSSASVICREPAIMCGQTWFNEVFAQLDDQVRIEWLVQEGEPIFRRENSGRKNKHLGYHSKCYRDAVRSWRRGR
ncbi:MAG: hypothetical protein B7Z05_06370, partial [Thiotrichales bacterium 32-46-8]